MKKIDVFKCCLLSIMSFLFCVESHAQHRVTGDIQGEKKEPLQNVSIFFFAQDTLTAGTISDAKGHFEIENLPTASYRIQYSLLGYKTYIDSLLVDGNKRFSIQLKEDPIALKELSVKGDRSDIVKMEAGSTTFYLSEEIKGKAISIYEALQEIPVLVVDMASQSISTIDGSSPVILINGINRGVAYKMIDPQNIEAVEVVDNPSARYRRGEGDVKVLNLRVKRSVNITHFANIYTRQHLDLGFGVYTASYGLEKEKYSLYLQVQDWYSRNDEEIEEITNGENLVRNYSGKSKGKMNAFSITGNGDWVISDKDYLSYGLSFYTAPRFSDMTEEGTVSANGGEPQALNIITESDTKAIDGNYNLFYRHTFDKSRHLDAAIAYGHNNSGPSGWRREESPVYAYYNEIDMDAYKHYLLGEINYDFTIPNKIAFNIGSDTYYQNISIEDTEGKFSYKETREYIYGDMRSLTNGKFSYMFSLGLDMVFRNSNHVHNNYITVLPSLSLAYRFRDKDALRLNVNRTRVSPSLGELNPRITTTDSLNVSVGNPYLKPVISNTGRFSYTLNAKKVYFEPYVRYTYTQNNIMSVGELEGDVYKSTYINGEHSQFLETGITTSVELGKLGRIMLTPYFQKTMIEDMSYDGKSWGASMNMYLMYKNISFNMNSYYTRYQYSRTTRSTNSLMLNAFFTWMLPKGWSLNFGLQNSSPEKKTWQIDGLYRSFTRTYSKYESWTPMIGFSYYFRSSQKQRYRNYRSGSDIESFDIGVQ